MSSSTGICNVVAVCEVGLWHGHLALVLLCAMGTWPYNSHMRARRYLLSFVLIAYVLFVMNGGCADKLILFPSTEPIAAIGASSRTIPIEAGRIEIWTATSPGVRTAAPQAYVLSFIGNADRAEYVSYTAADWRDLPVEVWRVNYPGYGGSTGPARLDRIAPAALAAYDALAAHADGKPIIVNGVSLGTTAALYVAANRPVAGLVLRTPPPLRQLIVGKFGWWNLWLLAGPVAMGVPEELDSLSNAAKVAAPAVFLFMDNDEVVPYAYQQKVAIAYRGDKQIVVSSGGQHNSTMSDATAQEFHKQLKWLWQRIAVGRPEATDH